MNTLTTPIADIPTVRCACCRSVLLITKAIALPAIIGGYTCSSVLCQRSAQHSLLTRSNDDPKAVNPCAK